MAATTCAESVNCEPHELHLVFEAEPDPLKPWEKTLSSRDGRFHSSPGVLAYSNVWGGGGGGMPKGIKQRERLGCNARLSAEFIQEQMLLGIRADVPRQLCMRYLGIRWLWGRGNQEGRLGGIRKELTTWAPVPRYTGLGSSWIVSQLILIVILQVSHYYSHFTEDMKQAAHRTGEWWNSNYHRGQHGLESHIPRKFVYL